MIKVRTKSGFVCEVDPERAKDWRFCKALAKCDSQDESELIQGMTFVVSFLLGKDEDKLIEHISKSNNGLAPVDKIIEEFKEILVEMGKEVKKSQSSQE